jgi:hypothetical protein
MKDTIFPSRKSMEEELSCTRLARVVWTAATQSQEQEDITAEGPLGG